MDRAPLPTSDARHWLRLLLVSYGCYLAALIYLVWTPSPEPLGDGGVVDQVTAVLNAAGFPVSAVFTERALNVVLFVPLSLIGSLVWRRVSVRQWALIGFITSCLIEGVQREFLPTRVSSSSDIIANTTGALCGVLVVLLFRHLASPANPPDPGMAAKSMEPRAD